MNFNESKLALAKNQAVAGVLFGKKVDMIAAGASAESVLDKLKKSSVSSRYNEFKSGCVERGHELMVAPEVVPVVAAFVKLVFSVALDKEDKRLKELKKSAASSYSVDFLLGEESLAKYSCLVIVRYDENENLTAAVAFRMQTISEFMLMKPKFYWASNTVANTKEVPPEEREVVTFMSGFSIQGIGEQQNGLPILATTGQDVKKIGKFNLGEKEAMDIKDEILIGPVPHLSNGKTALLRVSVTEIGDLGFSIDDRIAVNKAMKETIGPALAEGVKAYLSED